MMASLIRHNAYQILGLSGAATPKEQTKRANEIVQKLKIDEIPEYELDILNVKQRRSEEAVKDALRRLQSPRSRLKEYFFWFRIVDEFDRDAVRQIGLGNYIAATQIWRNAPNGEDPWHYTRRRNIALTYTLSLFGSTIQDEVQIDQSLEEWSNLLNSSEFWEHFGNHFRLDGDNLSEESISEYRVTVIHDLSDIYAELEDEHGGGKYIYKFQKKFNTPGSKIKEQILTPIWASINNEIIELEKIKLENTEKYDVQEITSARNSLMVLQNQFNNLIDIGLYENSGTKLLRDRAAMTLHRITVIFNNKFFDYKTSLKLSQIALALAGTESCKTLLKSNLDICLKNAKSCRSTLVLTKKMQIIYIRNRIYANDLKPIAVYPQQDETHLAFDLSFFNQLISSQLKPIKRSIIIGPKIVWPFVFIVFFCLAFYYAYVA